MIMVAYGYKEGSLNTISMGVNMRYLRLQKAIYSKSILRFRYATTCTYKRPIEYIGKQRPLFFTTIFKYLR